MEVIVYPTQLGSLVRKCYENKITVPTWVRDPNTALEWRKQDFLSAVAEVFDAHNGIVDDEYVRKALGDILYIPRELRTFALDILEAQIINGHPRRWAADILSELNNFWYWNVYERE